MRGWGWLVLLAVVLGGCVALERPASSPDRYRLRPPAVTAGTAPAGIAVARPEAAPGLATDRIAILRGTHRLDHLAGARWAAPLPRLVQGVLHEALEKRAGGAPHAGADLRLACRLWDFQAEYAEQPTAPPTLRVAMTCRLERAVDGRPLARATVGQSKTAAANRQGAVVAGLEALLGEVFDRIWQQLRIRLPDPGAAS